MDNPNYRVVGDKSVEAGRGIGQIGWYRFAAAQVAGHSVIDIGCGLGRGLEELRKTATKVVGQDLDERLARPDIIIGPLSEIPTKSSDFVTCIDVIEHVEDDMGFIHQLARIARNAIFISTPLWVHGRKVWPYHVREYTFEEFLALCSPLGKCTFYKGSPTGETVVEISSIERFRLLHRLLNNPMTNIPTRAFQKLLPLRSRSMAHQAARISVSGQGSDAAASVQ